MSLSVGACWCTHFSGVSGLLWYRRLRYAYRAPAFFIDRMIGRGAGIEFLRFDDKVSAADLDGASSQLATDVDILYVSSHGATDSSGYRVVLHSGEWRPVLGGLGHENPAVIVFDTCDLVDLSDPTWASLWEHSTVGKALRIVLGFSSPATVSQATSIRGLAFVDNLERGDTFADAWMGAIYSTRYQGTDIPVVLGFGDDQHDAHSALNNASLSAMPGPRMQTIPTVVRYP